MQGRSRTARPGDICILLEPAKSEVIRLREYQESLQSLFGGRLHEHVHLTCQRFELQKRDILPEVVKHIKISLSGVGPLAVAATSLVLIEAEFWQSRLLRWHIQITPEMRRLAELIEEGLQRAGILSHYSSMQTTVTALEEMSEVNVQPHLTNMAFPQHLFTGQLVVLSEIKKRRHFEILETIRLEENSLPNT